MAASVFAAELPVVLTGNQPVFVSADADVLLNLKETDGRHSLMMYVTNTATTNITVRCAQFQGEVPPGAVRRWSVQYFGYIDDWRLIPMERRKRQ